MQVRDATPLNVCHATHLEFARVHIYKHGQEVSDARADRRNRAYRPRTHCRHYEHDEGDAYIVAACDALLFLI